jgi:hypothetical protein
MKYPTPSPDGAAVIEVSSRAEICVVGGCGGSVVRHSLGGGQAVDRCTRCFRRYQVRAVAGEPVAQGRWRRFINDFVTWRE